MQLNCGCPPRHLPNPKIAKFFTIYCDVVGLKNPPEVVKNVYRENRAHELDNLTGANFDLGCWGVFKVPPTPPPENPYIIGHI